MDVKELSEAATVQPTRLGLLWTGLVAPVVFTATYVVDGATRPGYDQLVHNVSALNLGPRGWLGTLNLAVAGILTVLFARAVGRALPRVAATRWVSVLIFLAGVGWIIGAAFAPNAGLGYPPGATNAGPSLHNYLHETGALLVFAAFVAAPVTLRKRFGPTWRRYCVLTSVGVVASLALSSAFEGYDFASAAHHAPAGLLERVALSIGFFWFLALATALRRTVGRGHVQA